MKKFLTLTLALFLSLFIVGESEADVSDYEILYEGEIMGYHVKEIRGIGPLKDPVQYDLLIRYNAYFWYCELKPQFVNNLEERNICDKVDFIFPKFGNEPTR